MNQHSLGWVCAREDCALVGFVNVAWDGATHAFILDTVVSSRFDGVAGRHARIRGCDWLHVDFEDHLRPFTLIAADFE